jgi:integrase/recombinase XerD
MLNLKELISNYLEYCHFQKKLNSKTLKAYKIDLRQFLDYINNSNLGITRVDLSNFISHLHTVYKPKTVKRKVASLKALFSYLEYEEIILDNPFLKLKVKFQEPFLLPRTISSENLEKFFNIIYNNTESNNITIFKKKSIIRDIAVLETLFGTGLRVSELCSIKKTDISLSQGTLLIYGKGSKERIIQITNSHILNALSNYQLYFKEELENSIFFFINRLGHKLSEQSVRLMIKQYAEKANIEEHITPHMFRHTFATMLLEEDVDIRYIQQILGHSSIVTTQIYTHVTSNKQREILTTKHPRNKITF